MSDCLFCKIAAGEIPSESVLSDDRVVAFRDISPAAPVHVVVIPRQHFATAAELQEHPELTAHLLATMAQIGENLCPDGYRLVFNTREHGGQTVHHVHGHVLGGRHLQWPPG